MLHLGLAALLGVVELGTQLEVAAVHELELVLEQPRAVLQLDDQRLPLLHRRQELATTLPEPHEKATQRQTGRRKGHVIVQTA